MEIAAGVGEPDGPAVLRSIGEDENVRESRIVELIDDVRLRFPEAAREGEMAVPNTSDSRRFASIGALAGQRRNSGEMSRGRMSGICGQMMIAASTRIIGTSMIIVSLSA